VFNNPYAQVALTYLRRPSSSWQGCLAFFAVPALIAISLIVAGSGKGNDGFIVMLFPLMILSSFLSMHVVQQFADPRARLLPGFGRAHATIAAAAALAIGVLLPAIFTWIAGYRSVGPVAIAMLVLGTTFWQNLSQAFWINVLLSIAWLAVIMGLMGNGPVQQLVLGQSELLAVGLLAFGVVITLLGAVRLLRLDEDMPNYRRVVHWLRKVARDTSGRTATDESELPPGLSDWLAERRMASLTRHAHRASVSRWSQICRWQVGMISWRHVGPWIIGTVALYATRPDTKADDGFSQCILVLLPAIVTLFALLRRTRTMGHELCMPVARKTYLWQLGAAAALLHFQLWLIISAAVVLCWVLAAAGRPAYADIARALLFAGLLQVWFFGLGAWWTASYSFGSAVLAVIAVIIMQIVFLVPFVWVGPGAAGLRSLQLPLAALFAILGVLLTCAAYRCWLAADVD
jgi:hypothetical protein